jgi:hypothetical protein
MLGSGKPNTHTHTVEKVDFSDVPQPMTLDDFEALLRAAAEAMHFFGEHIIITTSRTAPLHGISHATLHNQVIVLRRGEVSHCSLDESK